jgi:electron transfer flavoprotein beta subunit
LDLIPFSKSVLLDSKIMSFKILTPVKRVIDYNVRIRVKTDFSDVESDNVKMSMNPFDEIALEEALRLKEAGIATEIVAVTLGVSACQDVLLTALAMGADRAIFIQTEQSPQPLMVATLLRHIIEKELPNLVLMGKQAIDDDCGQTGQMLAGMLNWPQATFASKIVITDNTATVTREIDGGLETLRLQLPAVITTDLRLNQPRYISLPNIMKAKQKKLDVMMASHLNLDMTPHLTVLKVESPPPRKPGIQVKSVLEY